MPMCIRILWYLGAFSLMWASFFIPQGVFNEGPEAMLWFGGFMALLGPFLPDARPRCACCKAREGTLDGRGDPVKLHPWEEGGTFYLCSACHAAASVILGGWGQADVVRCALHGREIKR